ncbi:MAG: hypothetical protein PHW15_00990 [Patescibacteria group bacterium]|nr:hypothetical protein [Patescibacteria group bacterium]MDD5172713.1 hypothetical protein [Patescibacteria group bacterium]
MSDKYRKTFNHHSSHFHKKNEGRLRQSRQYILKKKKSKIKFFLLAFLITLFFLSIVYFFFLSKFFRIKNIEINRTEDNHLISNEEIKQIVCSIALIAETSSEDRGFLKFQDNIFLFKKKFLEEMLERDSRIKSFVIKKDLKNTLLIEIAEARPIALLISSINNKKYYLNPEGKIIYVNSSDFTTPEEQNLPIFYDQTDINYDEKDINADNQEYIGLFRAILGLIGGLSEQNGIMTKTVKILEKTGIFEVEITTNEEWRILINSEVDFDRQKESLSLILQNEINDRYNLEQIDLRFDENIFYTLKK